MLRRPNITPYCTQHGSIYLFYKLEMYLILLRCRRVVSFETAFHKYINIILNKTKSKGNPRRIVSWFNTLRPRRSGSHFQTTFSNAFSWMKIVVVWSKFHWNLQGPINNIPVSVQIMGWRRSGDKPLPEPMMFSLMTHICLTRPQWDKTPDKLRQQKGQQVARDWF